MNIDQVDIEILKVLNDYKSGEEITTWSLTKKIYPNLRSDYEGRKKDSFIRGRVGKLDKLGLIKLYRGKRADSYEIVEGRCFFQNTVFIKINNRWQVFSF